MENKNETPLEQALVVFRHGCDLPNPKDPDPRPAPRFQYDLPDGETTITIPHASLSARGLQQACLLGVKLADFMTKIGIAPVGHVITRDPKPQDTTTNPFCTVYPVIDREKHPQVAVAPAVSVTFYDDDHPLVSKLKDNLKGNLFPDPQKRSTIICGTVQELWDKNKQSPQRNLILGYLTSDHNWNKIEIGPKKGRTIYVFRGLDEEKHCFNTLDVYYLHHDGNINSDPGANPNCDPIVSGVEECDC